MKFLFLALLTINYVINIKCDELTSIEQRCVVLNITITNNNSLDKMYLRCSLTDVTLFDESAEKVSTTLPSNDSNAVTSVLYEDSSINYIPNTIFTELPNLEQLIIHPNQDLVELRPHYFKNAKHLRDLNIEKNIIATLHAKVFEGAENLESINLEGNSIETVHIFAFYGLKRLQRINLADNNIKKLHPSTFSWLGNLVYLNLKGTQHCVNQDFNLINFAVVDKTSTNDLNDLSEFEATDPYKVVEMLNIYTTFNKFKDVEAAIHDNGCIYTLEDLQDIKTSDQIVDVKMNDFSSILKNLTKEISELHKLNKSLQEAKDNDSTRILVIIAIVLLIVLSCIGGFLINKNNKRGDKLKRNPEEVKFQVKTFDEKSQIMQESDLNEK